jgi:deferrochelatase/peroxidase EfeB
MILEKIWVKLQDLEKGLLREIDVHPKKRSSGNLSVMIGYGPRVFKIDGILKKPPQKFGVEPAFSQPTGGTESQKPLLDESKITYSREVSYNHALEDHIAIQLIADTDFYTSRALVELSKEIYRLNKETAPRIPIRISKFYNGFHSPTGRSLIGFHDGVANIRTSERLKTISIQPSQNKEDDWTVNGTYMGFLRIIFNLESWEEMDVSKQEIIIGRDKETGCPLIGIDRNGKPVIDPRCPRPGTYDVTDRGNEIFRNRPQYGRQILPSLVSDKLLQNSHIATTLPDAVGNQNLKPSNQIFRQSFQFLEPSTTDLALRIGLNFVSFQNSPENLYKSMMYKPSYKPSFEQGINFVLPSLHDFFTVISGGIFFIPPFERCEPFPGSSMFVEQKIHLIDKKIS